MDHITIPNLDKYQPTYNDGRQLIWIRWNIQAMRDYKIHQLSPSAKWLFICLVCLATERGKNEIPMDLKWLAHVSGVKKNHISRELKSLSDMSLIVTSCDIMCPTYKQTNKQTDIHNVHFEELWKEYPNRVGKAKAKICYSRSVKTDKDKKAIKQALQNYLKSKRVANGYVQNGSTWFNKWQDWIDYKEDHCPRCKGKGKYTSERGYEVTCTCPDGIRMKSGSVKTEQY